VSAKLTIARSGEDEAELLVVAAALAEVVPAALELEELEELEELR
jgi:hypothetical protein